MANVLSKFPDNARSGRRGSMLDQYADGRIYELRRGVDFQCSPTSLRTLSFGYAKRNKLVAKTHVNGEIFVLQFLSANAKPRLLTAKRRK
jgi:hypothetical protein